MSNHSYDTVTGGLLCETERLKSHSYAKGVFLETMEATHGGDGWRAPGGIMRLFIPSNGNSESSGVDCVEPSGEFL